MQIACCASVCVCCEMKATGADATEENETKQCDTLYCVLRTAQCECNETKNATRWMLTLRTHTQCVCAELLHAEHGDNEHERAVCVALCPSSSQSAHAVQLSCISGRLFFHILIHICVRSPLAHQEFAFACICTIVLRQCASNSAVNSPVADDESRCKKTCRAFPAPARMLFGVGLRLLKLKLKLKLLALANIIMQATCRALALACYSLASSLHAQRAATWALSAC